MRAFPVAAILVVILALGVVLAGAHSAFRLWEFGTRHALHDPYYFAESVKQVIVMVVFGIIHFGAVFACVRFLSASGGMASAWAFLGGIALFSAAQLLAIWPIAFLEMPERYVDYTELSESLRFQSLVAPNLAMAGVILLVAGWALLIAAAMRRARQAAPSGPA